MKYSKYFINADNLFALIVEYKKLFAKYYQEKTKIEEINKEFCFLFYFFRHSENQKIKTKPEKILRQIYIEHGLKPTRYKRKTTKEIAKILRKYIKIKHKDCVFSVRTDYYMTGSEINIYLLSAPFDAFLDTEKDFHQINDTYILFDKYCNNEVKNIMYDITLYIKQYQIEDKAKQWYNFMVNLFIGSVEKPYFNSTKYKSRADIDSVEIAIR